jgi:cation diffusion facilitator CzcD-associated flavoprotein CzcO
MLAASRTRQYVYHEARVLPLTKGIGVTAVEKAWERYFHAQIADEPLRSILRPDYPIGCKRVLISNDWYSALNRDNVEVIPAGLGEVKPHRVVGVDGSERHVDAIIFGTGFSTTEFLAPMSIIGRHGRELHDVWRERGGAEAFKGVAMPGFPNMFLLYGPNTNLGHNSIVYMLESQIGHVLRAVRWLARRGGGSVEVRPEVQRQFANWVQERITDSVWDRGCTSWYRTASGRNTTNWPEFTFTYRRMTRRFDPASYRIADPR